VISVALDRSAEDCRPYVEAAAVTHPSLVDAAHRVADLYRIINVPTSVWIDEDGRIVRPNDAAFGSDTFIEWHGIPSGPHMDALRAWVRENRRPLDPGGVRAHQVLPSADEQRARAEFGLAWHLAQQGRMEAAERHFVRAGELAPHDFTIRRGSLPIRGKDPMGADFADILSDWVKAGRAYYEPMKPGTVAPSRT